MELTANRCDSYAPSGGNAQLHGVRAAQRGRAMAGRSRLSRRCRTRAVSSRCQTNPALASVPSAWLHCPLSKGALSLDGGASVSSSEMAALRQIMEPLLFKGQCGFPEGTAYYPRKPAARASRGNVYEDNIDDCFRYWEIMSGRAVVLNRRRCGARGRAPSHVRVSCGNEPKNGDNTQQFQKPKKGARP